jgi:hypothetical protein
MPNLLKDLIYFKNKELETIHNAKLMAEYEKYQELQVKTTNLQSQWEVQMKEMQLEKETALSELTNHFEARLKEKQEEINQVNMNNFFLNIPKDKFFEKQSSKRK